MVEIKDDGSVRLLCALTSDEFGRLQGEIYNGYLGLNRKKAVQKFGEKGFWGAWYSIPYNLRETQLTGALSDKAMRKFMEMDKTPTIYCANSKDAGATIMTLEPGKYLFYVPIF